MAGKVSKLEGKVAKLGGKVSKLDMLIKWLILAGLLQGGQDVQVILHFTRKFAIATITGRVSGFKCRQDIGGPRAHLARDQPPDYHPVLGGTLRKGGGNVGNGIRRSGEQIRSNYQIILKLINRPTSYPPVPRLPPCEKTHQ